MNPTLQLVLAVLDSLVGVAANPALGLNGDGAKVVRVISLVSALGKAGEVAHQELVALDEQIKALEAAGGPIPDEVWATWENRLDAAHALLQAS